MANLKYENVWKLINKYKFKINIESHKDLMCVICRNILQNACQSPCGCRYCYWCIDLYLSGSDKYCPGRMEDCKDQNINLKSDIVFDLVANKRVSLIKVECPEDYCQFQDELRNMEEHIATHQLNCPFSQMGCHSRYKEMDEVNDHLTNETHSHANLLVEFTQNMQNEINSLKENGIAKDQLIGEMKTEIKQITEKLNNIEILFQEDSYKKKTAINSLKSTLKYKNEREDFLEKRVLKLESMYGGLGGNTVEPPYNTKDSDEESSVHSYSMHYLYAPFEWRIDNYPERRNDTKIIKSFIDSESFYSHKEGYKMILRIYPNGDEDGEDSHLSVYCCIIKSAFDETLSWPMSREIKIAILDQVTNKIYKVYTLSVKSTEKSSKCAFYKPAERYGNRRKFFFGVSKFMNSDDLINNSSLCRNGYIIIKCFIE